MYNAFNETEFELTTIERLKAIGYDYAFGYDLPRPDKREVVLPDRLRAFLTRRYPDLPPAALALAVATFTKPDGPDTLRRNKHFHEAAVRGVDLPVDLPDGKREHRHVRPIDWDDPAANDFLAVNQLQVSGQNDRRPDIVVYVNGLPLVLFELKNPFDAKATAAGAFNQIQHYRNDIPRLFEFNALVVVSDGEHTLHGQWPGAWEWYAPWRSIDGETPVPGTVGSMKALIEGLFRKDRLLAYVRDFIVFEEANERITKKAARYHQFFAARLAVERAVAAHATADKRVGVIWHTTGSGKSLSMLFLVGLLRRRPELGNPTIVIQVDRTDLDDQLAAQFQAGRSLVGAVAQADSADDLRELLRSGGGGVVLATIEKFRLKDEAAHPVLSDRANVFVLADEAHRSQYGFAGGYAGHLADALPNAKRIGFTGTPVSLAGADTVAVFGDLIHTYDLKQAQADKATVPIYYTPRQVKLHLTGGDVDAALDELTKGHDPAGLERKKGQWAALAAAAGAGGRVGALAADLLAHFTDRTATMPGKGMVVCMTRRNCVALYDALKALPACPEMKVVMTGNLADDPAEWSRDGHLTTKAQRDAIKQRLADPADPLALVIVCDMWLTGTDIPCLHTLYIDKPMRGHTIIQAISRVNRVFRDKPHGLVVDYIGIGDELREAAARYTADGGQGDPAPDLEATAVPEFLERLESMRALLPPGENYAGWRSLPKPAAEDLFDSTAGHLAEDDERLEAFRAAEQGLSLAFLLVKHIDGCRTHADEVAFYQGVRKKFVKALGLPAPAKGLEAAVRDLIDESIETEGVFDLFRAAGLDRADLSVLDDEFLTTFRDRKQENLRLKLLERLMADEIGGRRGQNVARAKLFSDRLRQTLLDYHNRQLDAAAVIAELLRMRREMRADDERAAALEMSADELAFYDAVATSYGTVYDGVVLRGLVHDVVRTLKANLKADWHTGHRPQVIADLRAAVRRTLRKHGVRAEHLEPIATRVLEQAAHTFANWPLLAV